jgi:DNA-binding transcriptional LysR family regulator
VGRKIYVTDFGKEVAQAAEAILSQVNAINHQSLAYKGQLYGKLKISVVSTGKYVLPYFLSGFMKTHDGIELEMDVTNKSKVLEALELNEVDFALVSILPEHLKIEQIDLMPNRLFLVGNKEYNFKKSVSPEQIFKQLPLIFREKGSGTRQAMERFINQNAIIVPKKMELTSNEAVKQAILAGLGCSVMPIIGIRKEIVSNELQIIPTKGLPIETTWRLIWLKGKNHTPVAAAFLDYLAKEKEQIIQEKFE